MDPKDYLADNGYKSRKFLLVLLAILVIPGLGILWSVFPWNTAVLNLTIDNMTTLILGYCGISAARVVIPTASTAVAKTITTSKHIPQSANNPVDNTAGSKHQI